MSPHVQSFFHADTHTWTHLAWDAATGRAAIIDPVLDFDLKSARTSTGSAARVMARVEELGLVVTWVLETHAHADHLTSAQWLRMRNPGAAIAIGDGIRGVQRTFATMFNLGPEFARDGSQFDRLFAAGEKFSVGGMEARIIPTPGHTDDSVSYLIGDALFVGDSLFMPDGGTARCDFPGGDAARLYHSIRDLYALPDETRVFVCHDYMPGGREPRCETTIGAQRRTNIHVRDDTSEADFVRMREARDATLSAPQLLLPAIQVNIRAGAFPPAEDDGTSFLKLPLNRL